jgi:hypothetical protein
MHVKEYITLTIFVTLFFSLFRPFKNEFMKMQKVKATWKEIKPLIKISFISIYLPVIIVFTSIIMLFITSF